MHRAQHTLKRILTILKVLVAQLDILETMTPLEFLSFRARLESASGFQSDQFRQIEFVVGTKSEGALAVFRRSRPREAMTPPISRVDDVGRFLRYLSREGTQCRRASRARRHAATGSSAVEQVLVDIYRPDPKNAEFCERLVDLDEGLQEWRYRHVKMVERTIGMKPGSFFQRRRISGNDCGQTAVSRSMGDPSAPLISQMERLVESVEAPRANDTHVGKRVAQRSPPNAESRTPEAVPNPLASHYSRFRVTDRILLTGHSHQAWPDVAFEAQQRAVARCGGAGRRQVGARV